MFKCKFLLLFVISSVVLTSCTKEKLSAIFPADALVKTKTEGNNTETYFYDNQNRLSKIVFSSSTSPSYYHEFTYSNGIISEYHSEEAIHKLVDTLPGDIIRLNCTSNPSILNLNDNGFYSGTTSTCQSQSYKYDAIGFVIAQDFEITDYSTTEQVLNDSKNVTKITGKGFSFGGGEFDLITTYTYYSDRISSIGNKNFGKLFLGKSSVNVLKSETKNTETINYTYIYDAEQRTIQRTAVKGTTQTITAYTYY